MLLLLVIWSVSQVVMADGKSAKGSGEYGKRMEFEVMLTAEEVARFANWIPPEENSKQISPQAALLASTKDWTGDEFNVGSGSGPYTIVVTLTGKAKEAGDVVTLWNSGWYVKDSTRTTPLPGLSRDGLKAGERVVMTKASQPIRFKEAGANRPVLELVNARNFEFESIKVQVWSGIGENSWHDIFLSFRWVLLGVVFLLLRWWARR
jgi:hypothetical protein